MSTHHRDSNETLTAISRRRFLQRATILPPLGTGLVLALDGMLSNAMAVPPCQERWSHCVNCGLLFFDGYQDKGRCAGASRGPHTAAKAGGDKKLYYLAFDDSTGAGQGDWRFCTKCKVLFYSAYPPKDGQCAGDGKGHASAGFNFFLYHDRRAAFHEEAGWRFCDKCYALFSATSAKPVCPANAAGHHAAGYLFVVGLKGHCIDDPCPQPPTCRG